MLHARLGLSRGARDARETADRLRAKGEGAGVKACEALAAPRAPPDHRDCSRSSASACSAETARPVYLRGLQPSRSHPHIGKMHYSLDTILPAPPERTKGDIFIRCPATGRPVPTGLHTATVVFDTLPNIQMRMHCPACHKDHWWSCTSAWVIESGQPS